MKYENPTQLDKDLAAFDDSLRPNATLPHSTSVLTEFSAAIVVACVAIPMGMGIASISGAPPEAGIIAGIIGGLLVGSLSGSPTSITGPSAGLTLVLASLIGTLNSFETFLLAVTIAGLLQVVFGVAKLGWLSSFFPSSVLDALLAAIGIILVLKQVPHLLGHDTDPEGDMAFLQSDRRTTFTELLSLFEGDVHLGAATVGLFTLALIVALQYWSRSKKLQFPSMFLGVVVGSIAGLLISRLGEAWLIDGEHLISLPVGNRDAGWSSVLRFPDWTQLSNPLVYLTAGTIAVIASLETLLNLSATDRIDQSDRPSPTNRELIAVGIGNTLCGLVGGIPMSAAVERSAVCLQAGSRTKLCAILHGLVLLIAATLFPFVFNQTPLSVLAAVLIVTGGWLARPAIFIRIWQGGRYQLVPFLVTIGAILLTDLLIGVVVGLVFAVGFILNSNLRRPLRQVMERHAGGEVLHIELAEQVSFLNRPVIERALRSAAPGTQVLLDATNSDYIDPDILAMIREFVKKSSIHNVTVSLRGFRQKYALDDVIQFVDFTSREIQEKMTPTEALKILQDGNERFCTNRRLSRDLGRQVQATSAGQHPFAAILSCIDSRAPVETILDLGVGDVFTARVAGNVVSRKVLGSLEYATAVVGSKLIVVLGHTKCGAVHAAVKLADAGKTGAEATGCQHLDSILEEIHPSIDLTQLRSIEPKNEAARNQYAENVSRRNVIHSVRSIVETSQTIRKLVDEGRLAVVGAVYDVSSGKVDFLVSDAIGLPLNVNQAAS
ncbi:MAG: SulP family inorganic anion transporter [Planctomycetota bacterium]|nr:SulP family inorganic anion transporter [Planctomycetota bacterium]MDA1178026.1 SulP family inorganic anion transporter [Planctomycetota bacterium]